MTRFSRILTAAGALLLVVMYFTPLWHIGLAAPQYPEGLGLRIHIDTITGDKPNDLTNINSLNHYIGMKPIEVESFAELQYLPWIVGGLVALGLVAAITGRRRILWSWVVGLALLGALGLADMWRWGYDYGHDLDEENAIIKVPGMAYQPPLLGSKQLLNFTATSWPAAGGIAAGVALLLGVAALVVVRRGPRTAAAGGALVLAACAGGGPQAIAYGSENCEYCRMTISDPRFAGQLITSTGQAKKFDSIECLASYYLAQARTDVPRAVYVGDFRRSGTFLPADSARFIHDGLASPMGLSLVAVASEEEAAALRRDWGKGELLDWPGVLALVERERQLDVPPRELLGAR